MLAEFGPGQAQFLLADLSLDNLGDRTASQALRDGEDPAAVWMAICLQLDVPKNRWHGLETTRSKTK